MSRFAADRSEKTGLPPATLVDADEEYARDVRFTAMVYDETQVREWEVGQVDALFPVADQPAVTWIHVDGVHRAGILHRLGDRLELPPLVLEDIQVSDHRPKLEDLGTYVFLVLRALNYCREDHRVDAEQVSLILAPAFLVSFQDRPGDLFDPIRERIRNSTGRVRRMGADYLAYALADVVVDNYFVVLEQMGDEMDTLQEEVVANPQPETLQTIYYLRRNLVFLRQSVWPLREVIGRLVRGDLVLIGEPITPYLRDLYDHTIQVIDTIETLRDVTSGMFDIYLSSASNRMNEVMKVLTIIATIFIPLTLVVGVYGMNFKFMPELEWRWGYPLVWAVMLVIVVLMLLYFRRKKWL